MIQLRHDAGLTEAEVAAAIPVSIVAIVITIARGVEAMTAPSWRAGGAPFP